MQDDAQRRSAAIEARHWWHVGRRSVLRSVLRSLKLPPGARILDFGAGVGGNFVLLREFGQVFAVEPSAEARHLGAAGAPDVPYVAQLEDLPEGSGFDAVVMLDVLEHLDARPVALRAVRSRMHPQATLLVTVPSHPWLFGQHDEYLRHKLRYTRRALRKDLKAGGFTIVWLSSMNTATLPLALGARVVEALRQRRTGADPAPRGMNIPPVPINLVRTAAFRAESFLPFPLPFGLSLVAVAKPIFGSCS